TGESTPTFAFTIQDAETPAIFLTLAFVSSNPAVIPPEAIEIGGIAGFRQVTVHVPPGTPAGRSIITITVTDAGGLIDTEPFTVTVTVPPPPTTPPNTPPTISV